MNEMQTLKKQKITPAMRIFLYSFIALFLCSVLTSAFMTSGFTVKVKRINLIGDNGANYSALMFVPKTVTNNKPAPGVILVHGNTTSSTQQSSHAIELSRRGYVVVSMDIAGRGQSELGEGIKDAELTPSLQCWINYLQDCPLVIHNKLILSSHSMGGLLAANAVEANTGIITTWIANGTNSNPNAIKWGINAATFGGEAELTSRQAFLEGAAKQMGSSDPSAVELGKLYEVNGLRFSYNITHRTHAATFWNKDNIRDICDYIQQVQPAGNPIPGTNQIWEFRDGFSMLGLVSVLLFMCAFVNVLVKDTRFFSIVAQPMPRHIGLPKNGFILSAVIGVLAVFLGYGKLAMLYKVLLPSELYLFPTILANGMVTFVLGITVVSIIMMVLFYFTDAKKHSAVFYDFGLTTAGNTKLSGELIWKSAFLSAIVVTSVYAWLKVMEDFTGSNFQTACMGLQSITPLRLRIALPYMVPYFLNFFVSGFAHNIERRLKPTGNAKKDNIIAMAVNVLIGTLGMALYVIVIVSYDYKTPGGNNSPAFLDAGLHSLFSYALVWFMASTTAITTACYRITGSLWTGAFINAFYSACALLSVVPMTVVVK